MSIKCIFGFIKNKKYNQFYNNNDDFKKFVYNSVCQCFSQCNKIISISYKTDESNCTLIHANILDENHYVNFINDALNYMISKSILIKIESKYYINITEEEEKIPIKLTWNNVKTLDESALVSRRISNEDLMQTLWAFRKLVVDSILNIITIKNKISDMKIFSVGSSNISSDYDITLYGNTVDKVDIITCFQEYFKSIFGEDSAIVFDTNIYGKAYIEYKINKNDVNLYDKVKDMYIVKNDTKTDQLIWCLVKYIRYIRMALGE